MPTLLALGCLAEGDGPARVVGSAAVELPDVPSDSDGPTRLDMDGDGYVEGDCAETDPEVHPGATELCNGIDDDCDGTIDVTATDARDWFFDADLDGYGDESVVIVTCWKPAGYTLIGGDCDDVLDTVHPGQLDWCDGVDQNCTGNEDDAEDAARGYLDHDGDGFGSLPARSCSPGPDFVDDGTDCDDGEPARHPGAVEVCNAADDDCDGEVDEAASDALTYYADHDGDSLGDAANATLACEAPSGFVADDTDCDDDDAGTGGPLAWFTDGDNDGFGSGVTWACAATGAESAFGGDCDDADAAVNPGAAEACDSPSDQNCDGLFGSSDVDGDGLPACTDCDDTDAATGAPASWYVDRDADGFGDATQSLSRCVLPAGFVADATDCNDACSVAYPGAPEVWYDGADEDCAGGDDWDADLDGYDAPAPDCDDTRDTVNPSATEVCANHLDDDCDGTDNGCASTGGASLADSAFILDGATAGDYMGRNFAVAVDYFGAGDAALIVAASATDSGTGTVYLARYSDLQAGVTAGAWTAAWTGEASGDQAGSALTAVGDLDGDGALDVATGAQYHGDGAVYLIPLATTGTHPLTDAALRLDAPTDAGDFGAITLLVPDVDGDGVDELVVSAPESSAASGASAVGCDFFYAGPLPASSASWTGRICGDTPATFWGIDTEIADVTGDGLPEMILSSFSGYAAWVSLPFVGSLDLLDVDGTLEDPRHGNATAAAGGVGDLDGDGYEDVFTGHPGDGTYASQAGVVHLHRGPLSARDEDDSYDWAVYGTHEDGLTALARCGGDVDGDGNTELLVVETAPDSTAYAGEVGLFYGPFSATAVLTDADLLLDGPAVHDGAGTGLLSGSDLNGDAFDDLLIGAPLAGADAQGSAYVWLGTGG